MDRSLTIFSSFLKMTRLSNVAFISRKRSAVYNAAATNQSMKYGIYETVQ